MADDTKSVAQNLAPPLASHDHLKLLALLSERLQWLDLTPLLIYLIDLTESSALPWLAEQFALTSDNGWSLAESEETKRALIKSAIELHRFKGTPWSVRQVIRNLGFGEVELREGNDQLDPHIAQKYPEETRWALYQVLLSQAITNDQAALLRRTLASFTPARCELASLDYTAAAIRYNNVAHHDGGYNHGSA